MEAVVSPISEMSSEIHKDSSTQFAFKKASGPS